MGESGYKQERFDDCQVKLIRKVISSLSMAFVWERSVEGDKYWRDFYDKLRAMAEHGTNDGKPWVDPKESSKPIELPDSVLRLVAIGVEAERYALSGVGFGGNALMSLNGREKDTIESGRACVAELIAEASKPTADPKPTADEPVIPKGYRRAFPEEYVRQDVKIFCISSGWTTRLPQYQGTAFEFDATYIVPIDQELTDEDAEQRRLVMYRDCPLDVTADSSGFWHGPLRLIWVKDDGSESKYVLENLQSYKQARLATPEEIEKSGVLNKP